MWRLEAPVEHVCDWVVDTVAEVACLVVQLLKVEETCRKSEEMTKELEERINQKLEEKEANRNAQIEAMVQRLREHVSPTTVPRSLHLTWGSEALPQ